MAAKKGEVCAIRLEWIATQQKECRSRTLVVKCEEDTVKVM